MNEVYLIQSLLGATKEERTEFWKTLFPDGIYCPYIPLQVFDLYESENIQQISFKTRYEESRKDI